jgi:hypothetical protein
MLNEEHPAYHITRLRCPARANLFVATMRPADLFVSTKYRHRDSNLVNTTMHCPVDPFVGPTARLRYFFRGATGNYFCIYIDHF